MRFERWFYKATLRLRSLFRSRRLDEELDEELRYHVEQKTAALVAQGLGAEEARRAALAGMEGLERCKEECRDARGVHYAREALRDVRYAARQLGRSPAFTVVAVLTLALGIGANTALFSIAKMLLLSPLEGISHDSRLVSLFTTGKNERRQITAYRYADFLKLRGDQAVFEDVAAYSRTTVDLNSDDIGEKLACDLVSDSFFPLLGVQPVRGRGFTGQETETVAAYPVVVVSYEFWKSRLHGSDNALGKQIRLNNLPFEVVGVAPEGFRGLVAGQPSDVWAPLGMQPRLMPVNARVFGTGDLLHNPGMSWLTVIGRLRKDVNIAQAGTAVTTLLHPIVGRDPATIGATPLRDAALPAEHREAVVHLLLLLDACAGLVLLIACVNIVGLLLERGLSRQQEIGTRLALGASRTRLIRQLLTESLLLAAIGGCAALAVAHASGKLLTAWNPFPLQIAVGLNGTVIAFTAALSLAAGFLFGLIPALAATRLDPLPALRGSALGIERRFYLRNGFVTIQAALSLLLIVGALLFARSLANIRAVNPAFRPQSVLLASANLQNYANDSEGKQFYARMLERIAPLPGVESAALSSSTPLARASGFDFAEPGNRVYLDTIVVTPGFFRTAGIELLRGRDFDRTDGEGGKRAVILNEAYARIELAGGGLGADPVGAVTRSGELVVGLVRDASRDHLPSGHPQPTKYVPFKQSYQAGMTMWIRARCSSKAPCDASALIPSIQSELNGLGRALPPFDIRTAQEQIDRYFWQPRAMAAGAALFSGLSLVLACIGVYGVAAGSMRRRLRELAVRSALGASHANLVATVLAAGLWPAAAGCAAGLLAAFAAVRLLRRVLFNVAPLDPLSFALATLVLLVAGGMACYLPARRSARIDPITVLRAE